MKDISYALGLNIGENLKQNGLTTLDYVAFTNALQSVFEGKPSEMNGQDANRILSQFFNQLKSEMEGKNLAAGREFLAENTKKEGVITLASGLQYTVLKEGNGAKPKATDKVTCHYHGTLIDGTVFDSSVERGEPAQFPVNGVIQGWVEALQLMNEGAKWKLFIPSHLAYGEHGAGQQIGPHTTLIFDVELISIN